MSIRPWPPGCGCNCADLAGRPVHPNLALLGPNYYDGQPFDSDFFPLMWSATGE